MRKLFCITGLIFFINLFYYFLINKNILNYLFYKTLIKVQYSVKYSYQKFNNYLNYLFHKNLIIN